MTFLMTTGSFIGLCLIFCTGMLLWAAANETKTQILKAKIRKLESENFKWLLKVRQIENNRVLRDSEPQIPYSTYQKLIDENNSLKRIIREHIQSL